MNDGQLFKVNDYLRRHESPEHRLVHRVLALLLGLVLLPVDALLSNKLRDIRQHARTPRPIDFRLVSHRTSLADIVITFPLPPFAR